MMNREQRTENGERKTSGRVVLSFSVRCSLFSVHHCLWSSICVLCVLGGESSAADPSQRFVYPGRDGKLVYEADERGNRVPDFSHCGYAGGGVPIPDVPVRVVVAPGKGDGTARIQAAIDYVSGLKPDEKGFRGTVLLLAGRHEVATSLRLAASGVVLRGAGPRTKGTVLVATGTDPTKKVDYTKAENNVNPYHAVRK